MYKIPALGFGIGARITAGAAIEFLFFMLVHTCVRAIKYWSSSSQEGNVEKLTDYSSALVFPLAMTSFLLPIKADFFVCIFAFGVRKINAAKKLL